jgi:XTP/dITP diphosphohydrolase
MKLYTATSNPGKLREFQLAAGEGIDIIAVEGIEPPEETGTTFEENASIKACAYSSRTEGLLFAEDSGIEVAALAGAPGVFSARFAGPGATDDDNNRKLIELLRGVADRRARYVCVIAVAEKGEVLATFRGEVEGAIVDEPSGVNGFGYDPHFHYPPFGATFAELAPQRKFEVSHRRRALDQLFAWLKNRFQVR